ncbi:MAG TPA: copper-binding protein [Terriglobales bacterium]|nr:copper-binding protein [Terriglobales bacterium]
MLQVGGACALLALAACSHRSAERTYAVEGTVISIDKSLGVIMLDEKAIPDYMEAMTMTYHVSQPRELDQLRPGDHVRATLRVADDRSLLENLQPVTPAGK